MKKSTRRWPELNHRRIEIAPAAQGSSQVAHLKVDRPAASPPAPVRIWKGVARTEDP